MSARTELHFQFNPDTDDPSTRRLMELRELSNGAGLVLGVASRAAELIAGAFDDYVPFAWKCCEIGANARARGALKCRMRWTAGIRFRSAEDRRY